MVLRQPQKKPGATRESDARPTQHYTTDSLFLALFGLGRLFDDRLDDRLLDDRNLFDDRLRLRSNDRLGFNDRSRHWLSKRIGGSRLQFSSREAYRLGLGSDDRLRRHLNNSLNGLSGDRGCSRGAHAANQGGNFSRKESSLCSQALIGANEVEFVIPLAAGIFDFKECFHVSGKVMDFVTVVKT